MTNSDTIQRRRVLHQLEDQNLSRRELARALARTEGLATWIRSEALRNGLETSRVETVLARLGTAWARRAVKRFFLSATAS